jgi:hypothetical protein
MKFNFRLGGFMPELVVPAVIGSDTSLQVHDVDAKIDTGADMSIIPEAIRKSLHLLRSGVVACRGARGEKWTEVPIYAARVRVAGGNWIELTVAESTNAHMLLGMDVLRHFLLFSNGPKQYFELKTPGRQARRISS